MVIDMRESLVWWCMVAILIRSVRTPDRAKKRRVGNAEFASNLTSAQAGIQQIASLIRLLHGESGAV